MTSYGSARLADYIITVRGAVTASTWHDRGLSVSLATLPELTAHGFGSMPMRSLTADGAAQVALGRLYRDVAEEKLDLLQFAASGTTESSATPP